MMSKITIKIQDCEEDGERGRHRKWIENIKNKMIDLKLSSVLDCVSWPWIGRMLC